MNDGTTISQDHWDRWLARTPDGVIDSELRVFGTENLFVCDASIFPDCIRVNPQWTIMAMADYFVNGRALA